MMCAVATGPNAIPVSLEWGNQLLSTAEGTSMSDGHAEGTQPLSETRWESGSAWVLSEKAPEATTDSSRMPAEATEDGYRSDATEIVLHWWRENCTKESYDKGGALCCVGATAVLRVELAGSPCEALLDIGASTSFISPKTVERLQLRVRRLPEEHRFTVATSEQLRIDRVVKGLTMWCGHSDKLRTYVNGQWCELPVVRTGEAKPHGDSPTVVHPRAPSEQAYEILAKQVADMSAEEAAIFVCAPPRRYKSHAKTQAKARITSLVRQAAADTKNLSAPLYGLHFILALPEAASAVPLRFSDEWQGALCCALIGNQPTSSGWGSPLPSTASPAAESDEESPWPMAKLEHTLFDEWINSTEAQHIPCEIAQVLHEYRAVFPDNLPKGLITAPKRLS
ncbi:Reverse transcriptase, related [Eimeria tenella]|uniref:Reverse transcriptase, related n=1 Tax=Eimeria tenella TaxID=5802 RepID=U6L1F2_EIMTE|nr:Reverse transcriptase, related [Eimeria tenella]CDJ43023.1 Reverse transcriptase, related [Eimeria tenella]|eukprot:XP_013233773.1 Reverse transcriptase, related [Eimeria tenella]